MLSRKFVIGFIIVWVSLLAACTTAPSPAQQVAVVAVWDLENLNPAETFGPDMGELLAAKVIETFEESSAFKVVERQRLILALEELQLSGTSLVDESTRLKIGRIVGARFMVFGSYFAFADRMRMDLRLVEVETGSIVKAAQKTASAVDLNSWLTIAQDAAQELL